MASDTKRQRDDFFEWLDNASDAEIGALVKEYLQESAHGSWEGFRDRRGQVRGIQELLADMNRYREAMPPYHPRVDDRMGTVSVHIKFEVSKHIDVAELLCTAIHESDALALTQLEIHVANIEEVSG